MEELDVYRSQSLPVLKKQKLWKQNNLVPLRTQYRWKSNRRYIRQHNQNTEYAHTLSLTQDSNVSEVINSITSRNDIGIDSDVMQYDNNDSKLINSTSQEMNYSHNNNKSIMTIDNITSINDIDIESELYQYNSHNIVETIDNTSEGTDFSPNDDNNSSFIPIDITSINNVSTTSNFQQNSSELINDSSESGDYSRNNEYTTDEPNTQFELIHNSSNTTINEVVLRCLNLFTRENITKKALNEVLSIIQQVLPEYNNMPKTVHNFFKYLENASSIPVFKKHHYCRKCYLTEYICEATKNCSYCDSNAGDIGFFFELDIGKIIKDMFETRNLADKLKTIDTGPKNVIKDITDGSEYIRVNSRENRGKYDLTLIFNTDGLSLVNSAKSHCWPLMFSIAELPDYLRDSFISVTGLWYDKEMKPSMNTFLKPFCQKLEKYYENGVNWIHPQTGETHISKIVAPLLVADAPARAQLQNITNYNSFYGCNLCEIKTKPAKKILRKKTTRIFPYSRILKLRSHDRMIQQGRRVILPRKRRSIRGVKGPSVLSNLPLIDLGTCLTPEFLHSVLLGSVKQFIKLLFFKSGVWSLKSFTCEINKFLKNIKPPDSFGRMPRPITDYAHFKAYEFLYFLLFYSLPIFSDIMTEEYLQHWILLVKGINNLLQKSIPISDIDESEEILKIFVKSIPNLYSDRELSYNVHQLLHLGLIVRRWGPLWSASAFPYENMNGILAKCVHGKNNIGMELIKNITIAHGAQILKIRKNNFHNEAAPRSDFKLLNEIKNLILSDTEKEQLIHNDLMNCRFYSRVSYNNVIYTSKIYREIKTNNYTVQVDLDDDITLYGIIRFHIVCQNVWYCILQLFEIIDNKFFVHEKTNVRIKHIIPISEKNEIVLIKPDAIRRIRLVIRVGDYVCKIPGFMKKNL